jgi:hypothetical protein
MAIAIRLAWAAVALGALACVGALQVVEKVPQGPKAAELFYYRSYLFNNREPSFDERRKWEDLMDERVTKYLREHSELEQATRYSDFRFWRQVVVGSTRDEVRTLLDEPDEQTTDPALMASMAMQHWSTMQPKVKEAWVYPPGWVLYFDDDGAVSDITRKVGKYDPVY